MSSSVLLGTACIERLGLFFHKRSMDTSGKCNIAAPGNGVYVAVYELSTSDKQTLDEIEGVGNGYADRAVDVPGFGKCRTYISESSHVDEAILPFDWYREIVLLGCRYQGFPRDYVRLIERVVVTTDPDAVRSREKWQLIERMNGAQ